MRKLSVGAIGVGLFAVVGVACSSADGNGGEGAVASAGTTTTKSFDVSIQCGTPSQLPACTAALSGQTAFVASLADLYSCEAGRWFPIPCTPFEAGAVAYASTTKTLWACEGGSWGEIALPSGPAGDAGPQGAQGEAGATGATGPQGPSGDAGATGATGATGSAGPGGDAGLTSLVNVTAEPAGANCANGGEQVQVGIDTNGDGVLEASEVQSTAYVCNGLNGDAGAPGSALDASLPTPTAPLGAAGTDDLFMSVAGVEGPVNADGKSGQFTVEQMGVSLTMLAGQAPQWAVSAQFDDESKGGVQLEALAATDAILPAVTLTIPDDDYTFTVKLTNAVIATANASSFGSPAQQTQTVTFTFDRIDLSYDSEDDDSSTAVYWDNVAGQGSAVSTSASLTYVIGTPTAADTAAATLPLALFQPPSEVAPGLFSGQVVLTTAVDENVLTDLIVEAERATVATRTVLVNSGGQQLESYVIDGAGVSEIDIAGSTVTEKLGGAGVTWTVGAPPSAGGALGATGTVTYDIVKNGVN